MNNKKIEGADQMNEPQLFNFKGQQVRTMTLNDEPYFIGRDLTAILQYSNGPKAIRDHVDADDKLTERIVLSNPVTVCAASFDTFRQTLLFYLQIVCYCVNNSDSTLYPLP